MANTPHMSSGKRRRPLSELRFSATYVDSCISVSDKALAAGVFPTKNRRLAPCRSHLINTNFREPELLVQFSLLNCPIMDSLDMLTEDGFADQFSRTVSEVGAAGHL
jgi:hypothetical protein